MATEPLKGGDYPDMRRLIDIVAPLKPEDLTESQKNDLTELMVLLEKLLNPPED
ncbi:hypothetical protein PX699_00240 [Sphingobium sp. H39-3-25]|uniref:hypothetical protein n=1 Tax=Sphingobium arseniciresistens TaxID=3030834 RepID=UPI0023B996B4|nr:hypothetical protein [Sphingobium arseniciresistens]